MKKIAIKLTFLASVALILIACDKTMGDTDSRLTDVKGLVEPLNGKAIQLDPSPTASVYFEWDYASVENAGTAIYQIAFDKQDGNFSNPVYVMNADNNGYSNSVTISHKQMNKIAKMAGILTSETGSFKWTVFSIKGTKSMKSGQENTITVTRLAGLEPPVDVFLTGEGSEGGTDASKASKMKSVSNGVFEVYTKLAAGKPYYFTEDLSGSLRKFYTSDGLIKENGTTTVAIDGIYRITLDFETGACTYSLVTRIGFYFSPEGKILFDLPYIGYGIFRTKATVTFKQEGWGRDERYKFRMFIKENGGAAEEKELEWSTYNGTDSRPLPSSPDSYYYMLLIENLTQWDNKWKLMGDFDDVEATYTIYLTADQPYTHSITK